MNSSIPLEWQTLRVELLSDTTFGRGEGTAGQVDVEVDHDELGIPFVNGKTIRSLLRDTWLTLQRQFPELVESGRRVFGPHGELNETSILRVGRASIDETSRQWVRAAVERNVNAVAPATILAGFTDIRSQTSEDRATGAPERTTLRSVRVLLRGLVLATELHWLETPTSEDMGCLALALLGTRHAGLSRNRGRGHVRFGLGAAVSANDSVTLTRKLATASGESTGLVTADSRGSLREPTLDRGAIHDHQDDAKLGVWYVPYSLTLKLPAIVTGFAHDPNTVSTLRYIPGSILRGAVARAIGNPDRDTATRDEFNSLVLGGNVAWLNAYPLHEQSRTLPAPPGWRRDKQQPGDDRKWDAFDLASFDGRPDETHELQSDDVQENDGWHWPKESLAGLGDSFVTFGATKNRVTTSVSARVHQQRDRAKGRSWTDTSQGGEQPRGTLFAFESLDADQAFGGTLQIRAGSESECVGTLQRVRELLSDSVLLGRSRRAEYGGDASITFEFIPNRRREWLDSSWTGDIHKCDKFRVLLVSPCLVRNPDTGQFDPGALPDVIEQKFAGRATVKWLRTGFETVGGFNRKWRLELPQALAVLTGSVIVLEATESIPASDLLALENAGLGDRRSEGFGRFAITKHESNGKLTLTKPDKDQSRIELSSSTPELIECLQKRLSLTALERAIDETASDFARNAKRRPSNSLIGRLRELLREQTDSSCQKAMRELRIWLRDSDEDKRLKKPAMDQLDRCRVGHDGSSSLTRWLLDVLDSPIPRDMNLPSVAARFRLIPQHPSNSDDPVLTVLQTRPDWLKVRLIDAVLDQMALLNRQQNGEK